MFFLWAPELSPLKSKMIYVSSKDAIRRKFQGIKHKCQANRPENLNRACTAKKLGGSLIVALKDVLCRPSSGATNQNLPCLMLSSCYI